MKTLPAVCCIILFSLISCATLKTPPESAGQQGPTVPGADEDRVFPLENAEIPPEVESRQETIPPDLAAETPVPIETFVDEPEIAVADSAFLAPPETKTGGFVLAEPDARALPDAALPPEPVTPAAAIPETAAAQLLPPASPQIKEPAVSVVPEAVPAETAEAEIPAEPEGGIWLEEDERPYIAEFSEPFAPQEPVPTRKSAAALNQFIDIDYPGSGWIYLGENRSDPLLSFSGRKLTENGTQFVLRSKKPGITVLHFYKQDLLKNAYIDDFIEVTVSDKIHNGTGRAGITGYPSIATNKIQPPSVQMPAPQEAAPAAPQPAVTEPVPAAVTQTIPQKTDTVQPAPAVPGRTATVIQTDESPPARVSAAQNEQTAAARAPNNTVAPQNAPAQTNRSAAAPQGAPDTQNRPAQAATNALPAPQTAAQTAQTANKNAASAAEDLSALSAETLLAKAKENVASAPAQALAYLEAFFAKAVSSLDEGYLLRGQAYETRGPSQNIRSALESYQTLMNLYPASPYWKQASERVTYLNRFYFNIR